MTFDIVQNPPLLLKSARKIAKAQRLEDRRWLGCVHFVFPGKTDGDISFDQNKVKEKDPCIRSQLPLSPPPLPPVLDEDPTNPTNEPARSPYIILYFTRPLTVSRLYTLQLIYRATFIPRISRRMRASLPFYTAAKTSGCRGGRLVARERERERELPARITASPPRAPTPRTEPPSRQSRAPETSRSRWHDE